MQHECERWKILHFSWKPRRKRQLGKTGRRWKDMLKEIVEESSDGRGRGLDLFGKEQSPMPEESYKNSK